MARPTLITQFQTKRTKISPARATIGKKQAINNDCVTMSIRSELESNRVEELETLLQSVQPKILAYIAKADPNHSTFERSSLGIFRSPEEIKAEFEQHHKHIDGTGIANDPQEIDLVINKVLELSVNTWNPGFLDKLYALNNPIGVVSDLILSVLNTNSHVYTVSPVLSVLENYVGRKYAQKFFTGDSQAKTCGGLTFSGGSWSNITSMQIARSLKYPQTKLLGNSGFKFAVFALKHCHYSVEKAAILLGFGSKSIFKVNIHSDGTMDVEDLERKIAKSLDLGFTPLYINATAGTTVFGSFDNFEAVSKVAKKHNVWFHIDGLWGGNVVFSPKHAHKVKGAELADSITVNPHKMLGVPTTCSFLLLPHVGDFRKSMSLAAPYLFHNDAEEKAEEQDEENYDLADGTMGCGRRADSFKFYMAWLYYGEKGFADRVTHAFDITQHFVEKISKQKGFSLVVENPQCLQVCFYYKPVGFDNLESYTEVTRYISKRLHAEGKYLVDFSPNPASDDKRGEFFRVVFNSPILTNEVVDHLIESIISVGEGYKEGK